MMPFTLLALKVAGAILIPLSFIIACSAFHAKRDRWATAHVDHFLADCGESRGAAWPARALRAGVGLAVLVTAHPAFRALLAVVGLDILTSPEPLLPPPLRACAELAVPALAGGPPLRVALPLVLLVVTGDVLHGLAVRTENRAATALVDVAWLVAADWALQPARWAPAVPFLARLLGSESALAPLLTPAIRAALAHSPLLPPPLTVAGLAALVEHARVLAALAVWLGPALVRPPTPAGPGWPRDGHVRAVTLLALRWAVVAPHLPPPLRAPTGALTLATVALVGFAAAWDAAARAQERRGAREAGAEAEAEAE